MFKTIEEVVSSGFKIEFSTFAFNLEIIIQKERVDGTIFKKQSNLPMSDHFYEAKIIDCIEWMVSELNKEMYQ